MGYERYPRGTTPGDYYNDRSAQDYGWGRDGDYSSARDYQAAGELGGGSYGGRDRDQGRQEYGAQRYGQRERMGGGWGSEDRYRGQDRDEWRSESFTGGRDYYRGGEDRGGADRGRRVGVYGDRGREGERQSRGGYGRPSQGHGNEDRGFMARAGDEVRSWFGDEEAEHRREADARRDEREARGGYGRDEHYHSWRNQQLAAFDRDYHEYRQENQSKFHNEFASFRTERQGQRDLLNRVEEHAEVVGSDGEHVGTVDKVRGDRIILTKNDVDAGGRHHSIPSRWLQSAEGGKVMLRKTAAEAKAHWRDEERQDEGGGAMFGQSGSGQHGRSNEDGSSTSGTNLNRSFSGTY